MANKNSQFLALVLRHKPELLGLSIDKEGWALIDEVCELCPERFTPEILEEIVRTDTKGRYAIDRGRIRANQGHSLKTVQLTFKTGIPPVVLYHGTSEAGYYDNIAFNGLKPMSRHHVHLSADEKTASQVAGRRKGQTVLLKIDCKRMLADGHKFYISNNGVWLVDAVPMKYIST